MPLNPSEVELENVIHQIVTDIKEPSTENPIPDVGVIEVSQTIREKNFKPLGTAKESRMVAVDGGSSTILDAGSFVVAAVRVGSACYQGRSFVRGADPEMHLLHLSTSELAASYSIFFGKTVGGEPPDTPRGLEEAVGRIRTLLEWKHLEDVLASDILPGTVLAFDGALWAGIKGIGDMLGRIVETARKKEVILCGISKKSMLTHLSRPLIPAVQLAGSKVLPDSAWHYHIDAAGYGERMYGDLHIVKLHPHSRYAFRVDMSLPDDMEPGEALSKLAYHANDPTYVGYPYPLARVHNDVAFSRSEVEDLRNMLRAMALRKGMDPGEWQFTFQNFHDVLDMSR